MKIIKHVTEQPFVFATGLAALVHSTWSLGTLFAGTQPATTDPLKFAFWLVPALLISFALDVGQIATSAEIREGQRTATKYITFTVFAVATYYLQWLYIAHHMPQLELASGVRQTWASGATILRDAAVWIIPALLPLSTLLYTLSTTEPSTPQAQQAPIEIKWVEQPRNSLPEPEITEDDTVEMEGDFLADSPTPIRFSENGRKSHAHHE